MSCVTTPTATQTAVVTSQSESISTSNSVTTAPPTTSTRTTTSCAASSGTGPSATCISVVEVTSVTVVPGGPTTVQVPVTVTVPVTRTDITTLFGTSCVSGSPDPPITTPSTSVLSTSTPPPQVITSESSSTLANGSVVVQTVTTTSTIPPTVVSVPTTITGSQAPQQNNDGGSSSANLGPIIGGVVGGFFGLIGIVAAIWFLMKRKSRWDDIFDKEDDVFSPTGGRRDNSSHFSLDTGAEPKPYQYGLVGQVPSQQIMSPHSPPLVPSATLAHSRRLSASAPPINPSSSVASGPPTSMSRPSSAGSTQPLRPPSQQGQLSSAQSITASDFSTRPSSMQSHIHTNSITAPPVTFANWNNNINVGGNFGMGMGMAGASGFGGGNDDPNANRSGTPTSFQEPRRLQLANPTLPSAASSVHAADQQSLHDRGLSMDSTATAGPSGPSSSSRVIDEFDPYSVDSIDNMFAAPGGAGTTRVNTKGRIVLSPPTQVRVAMDGGRVNMAGSSSSAPSGFPAAPPAYEA